MDILLGSTSMIGRQIKQILPDCLTVSHDDFNLTNFDDCYMAMSSYVKFNRVFLLAGYNGGVQFNLQYPFDIFHTTSQINLNVLKCCEMLKPKKLITVVASCAYPDRGNKFLHEQDIMEGSCNSSVEAHGMAKRLLFAGARQLYKQYGVKTINTALTNCYGPGDRFDLSRTKIVGAAVKRICDAKLNNEPSVTFYGTGKPLREIMHCRDAAQCLVGLSEVYDDYENLVNIGSDQEVSIADLVKMVVELVDYKGIVVWDTTKTDGQMRKKLESSKMRTYIEHEMTPLRDGLQETIDYYVNTGKYLDR